MAQPTATASQQGVALRAMSFWPTVFFVTRWPEHAERAPGIIDYCYALRDRAQRPIASGVALSAKPAKGLAESGFDLLEHDHEGLRALRAFIGASVAQAASSINGKKVPPERIDVAIDDAWFHITNDGGFHDTHTHAGCSWCGIYYLRVGDFTKPKDGAAPNGGNRFYSPLAWGGVSNDYGNEYLFQAYIDPPLEDGMLLLFPSFLRHSALPYAGRQDRVVIAFNTRSALRPA